MYPAPVPGEPTVSSDLKTATSISLFWSIPSGSVVDNYLIQWIRDVLGSCPGEDSDNTTITNGSYTRYTITGLEEDSRYVITVTASNGPGSTSGVNYTAMTGLACERDHYC